MNFHLQNHLDNEYSTQEPKFLLKARTLAEFELWQSELREALASVLNIAGRIPTATPPPEFISSEDKGNYTEEKYYFMLDDVPVPMYLLIPKSSPPYKAVLTLHGHGSR